MVTSQQSADAALQQWQQLRNSGLTPEQRLDRLMAEFFLPPIDLDVRYQDQIDRVSEEMSR